MAPFVCMIMLWHTSISPHSNFFTSFHPLCSLTFSPSPYSIIPLHPSSILWYALFALVGWRDNRTKKT